jgi:hypothetical protein
MRPIGVMRSKLGGAAVAMTIDALVGCGATDVVGSVSVAAWSPTCDVAIS